MDVLLAHIERSARRLKLSADLDRGRRLIEYVESFRSDRPPNPQRLAIALDYPTALILAVIAWVLADQEFDTGKGPDYARGIVHGRITRDYDGKEGLLARIPRRSQSLPLSFTVEATVGQSGDTQLLMSGQLPSWAEEFESRVRDLLRTTPPHILALVPPELQNGPVALSDPQGEGGAAAGDPSPVSRGRAHLLGPGESLTQPIRGNLLDYSGFAAADELEDFYRGDLPLGRYSFAMNEGSIPGRSLYIGHYRTGAPMIYNGALICAPQNSGKTELILRWAVAANTAGYSVFLVDVKGNMREKLADKLSGKVRYFSTDPRVVDCDRINFLQGLNGLTPVDGMRIRQLAEALLPHEGWEEGEQAFFHQNHVNWLSGLVHILLLHQHYLPEQFGDGGANLSHLYEIASSERRLYRVMTNIAVMEDRLAKSDQEPVWPGLSYWMNEISLIIEPGRGGERSKEYTYRTLTQTIVNALRPFSRFGTLYSKTSSDSSASGSGPVFSFEDLNDPDEPVTIILSAREQDLDDATTVVSMAVRKLQQFLFDRMGVARPRPVLLLLDETRRIRAFKPNEYVTFAREAKAGCVLVYQSLDQIGDEPQITEILENIGTQVYLGSLVGNTAKYFIGVLPMRYRPTYSENSSFGTEGLSRTVQVGQEQVGYVTSNELYCLPAGKWPALVYVNDQPRRKPFLVDLDKDLAPN